MTGRWAGRLARRLARWTGDEGRAAEIRGHLDDAEAAGHPTHLRDVASVSSLVVRRAARDLPWWLAGLPIPVLFAGILAMTYETHFHAWDVVGTDEFARTASTVAWMRAIETAALIGVVAALVAGRRVVHQLRQGELLGPTLFATAIIVAVNQIDLFVERTAWWRDGGLQAQHVNDISPHSIALFLGFALLPVAYLVAARSSDTDRRSTEPAAEPNSLDSVAVIATALPLTAVFFGLPVLLMMLICVWLSRTFSRALKLAVTAAIGLPAAAAAAWVVFVGPIDDLHPVVTAGLLLALATTWFRMVVATVRPHRDGGPIRRTEPA